MRRFGSLAIAAGVLLAACGGDDSAEPTDRELVAAVMPGTPTEEEIDSKLAAADLLCGLDSDVVSTIWNRLDREQFEFQEFVFQHRCARDDDFLLELRTAKKNASTTTTSTTTTRPRLTTTTRPRATSTSTSTSTSTPRSTSTSVRAIN